MQLVSGPKTGNESTSRLAALDVLRCAAALLGIVLHSAVAYMPSRMPGLVWPVHNVDTLPIFDVLFWSLHAFRIPLFFVISGFFAEMQFNARGVRDFIAHRRRRIAFPYYLGIATVLPLTLIVWNFGWYLTGRATLQQMINPFVSYDPELQQHYFGSAHLWFLADLFLLNVAYAIIRREWGGMASAKQGDQPLVQPSAWMPFRLACLSAWPLWGAVHVVIVHNNSFIPNSARCAYYGLYFVVGAAAYRRRSQLLALTRHYRRHLALAVPAIAAFLLAVPFEIAGKGMWLSRLGLSLSATLTAWLMIFGLFGWSLRHFTAVRPTIRYLSDASYWLYLCHLPLVGLAQIGLHFLPWLPAVKFAIVTLVTFAVGLASYQVCIRYTAIGEILHGARRRAGEVFAEANEVARPLVIAKFDDESEDSQKSRAA